VKPMTSYERALAYRKVASDAIDYIWTCSEHGVVPLKRDAALFGTRLEQVRSAKAVGKC